MAVRSNPSRGNTWQYLTGTFRSETRSPLQVTTGSAGSVTYFDKDVQAITSVDPIGRTTRTVYDDFGRVIQVTRPEGDMTLTSYDVRGNVTRETKRAKPGSGLADQISDTAYVTGPTSQTCANLVVCNKPSYSIDPRGFRTNYDWDNATGQLKSMTSGLDGATGTVCQLGANACPLTTLTYTTLAGFDPFNSTASGTLSVIGSKAVAISATDTTTTSYTTVLRDYSPLAYTGMTLNPVKKVEVKEILVDSGGLNLRTCFRYDAGGNVLSVTEPRAGLASCP